MGSFQTRSKATYRRRNLLREAAVTLAGIRTWPRTPDLRPVRCSGTPRSAAHGSKSLDRIARWRSAEQERDPMNLVHRGQ